MRTADSEWTKEEDAILKEYASTQTYAEIAVRLKRTESAVATRSHRLGISAEQNQKPWTTEETNFIRANAHRMTNREMGDHLNRSTTSVKSKAQKLGIKERDEKTASEIEHHRQSRTANNLIDGTVLVKCKSDDCSNMITPHTYWDSKKHIWKTKEYCHGCNNNRLGQTVEQPKNIGDAKDYYWSKEEDDIVKTGKRNGETHEQIAQRVDRTKPAVDLRVKTLGLSTVRGPNREWAPEEIEFLKKHYATMKYRKIAEYLGRGLSAIKLKVRSLNLPSKYEIA